MLYGSYWFFKRYLIVVYLVQWQSFISVSWLKLMWETRATGRHVSRGPKLGARHGHVAVLPAKKWELSSVNLN